MKSPLMACLVRLATGATARWVGCGPALCQRIYFASGLVSAKQGTSTPVARRGR